MSDEFKVVHRWAVKLPPRQGVGYNLAQAFGIAGAHFGNIQDGEWELVLSRKGPTEGIELINA